jgi:hypothetical protein
MERLSKLAQKKIVKSRIVGARHIDPDASGKRCVLVDAEDAAGGDEDAFLGSLACQLDVVGPLRQEEIVNRRRNGTPYRLPKGTPPSGCVGSARVGPELSI